jgi:hypothetical protein
MLVLNIHSLDDFVNVVSLTDEQTLTFEIDDVENIVSIVTMTMSRLFVFVSYLANNVKNVEAIEFDFGKVFPSIDGTLAVPLHTIAFVSEHTYILSCDEIHEHV